MTNARYGDVSVATEGRIALVTIAKPPNNMMSVELARDIASALEALDAEADIRAIVLASEGKNFCAGADLSSRPTAAVSDTRDSNPLYEQTVRLFSTATPIIAAVQGAAVGAGLGLAMIADFRVAASDARFAANFTRLGFHPGFGLTHTLPRVIGGQAASLMMLTSRRLKADDALAMGLVDQVTAPEDLLATAKALAAEIAENAPLAIKSTRKTLRADLAAQVKAATDREFAEQKWLMKTDDFREGVKAVAERRAGQFKGR